MFLAKFNDFATENNLFAKGDKVLLAVSGGKDSVLMAHLFKLAGYNFGIAHCNFGLRGDESLRDKNFVSALADELQVPFYTIDFDTIAYALSKQLSTQMAARDLRYQYFEDIRQQNGYQKIATAHHQNDAIETVLFNLIRGTGIAGLHGIKSKRGQIIRPILCFDRGEIDSIIRKQNYDFVEDSSNQHNKYTRNHIRQTIIPAMRVVNPGLEKTFKNNIAYYQQVEAFLEQEVLKIESDIFIRTTNLITINKNKLKAQAPIIVYELLKPFGFSGTDCNSIILKLDKLSGLNFFSKNYHLIIDRSNIFIKPILVNSNKQQQFNLADSEVFFMEKRFFQSVLNQTPTNLKTNLNTLFVDADKLIYPLTLRNWQQGDAFIPFGMNGVKKVSDFFINQKLSIFQKAEIPILVNGNGQIIWICGLRSDDRFKISAQTKKVISIEQFI
ncbi:MAG: tRNA lysidine(34) synthetase TilS [Sphingobacteriales bacterium]|nr:MAG: tRNA lysidine(34) synthetase TilS [Sphingobacteriales bacterium]